MSESRRISVLVIEDNPADAGLIRAMLTGQQFDLTFVGQLRLAIDALAKTSFDVILMDLGLPDSQGLDSLQKLISETSPPIVVMTGLSDEQLAMQALQKGAQDYIVKGAEADHFIRRSLQYAIERHQIEKQLRDGKEQYRLMSNQFRTLFNGIPDGLVLLSPDLEIIWANDAACMQIDDPGTEISGKKCYDIFRDRTEPCPDCITKRCFESGEPLSDRLTTEDGRILGLRAFPIKDSKGVVYRVIELSNDITEKVRFQSETLRTGQLASLGEMAAGVAHEINNPINGVINYADVLKLCAEDPEQVRDIATRIGKESDRIAAIVSKLLHFARQQHEDKMPVSITDILNDTLGLIGSQLRKSNIQTVIEIPAGLPAIMARGQQAEQVFLNLLSNARYALDSKFPNDCDDKQIVIRAGLLDENFIRISFEDNGPGIEEKLLRKILDPFFSTKPPGEGTGLGLSISHGIIQEHGGRLTFESEPGEFTRFLIDLPVCR